MKTIGVRELQPHPSAALRRVAQGEVIGVTDRGRLVAILRSPANVTRAAPPMTLRSSHLSRTEALRGATRLGVDRAVVDEAVAIVSLILAGTSTYMNAGLAEPSLLHSLDALHLASALELGEHLEGIVAYDDRLIEAVRRSSLRVVTPGRRA